MAVQTLRPLLMSFMQPPLGTSWVFWTQRTDSSTFLASLLGVDYTSRPLEAVNDAFTSLGKPQLHFHSDIDCQEDLSSFCLLGSPDLFVSNGQIYSIWVNVVIFSGHRASNDKVNCQILILLQHALKDIKSEYWDSSTGGRVESGDATLQESIKREVNRNAGLHLSDNRSPPSG
ncbi:hypothetical protein AnigIFM50267_003120 [Aspergillus niger]|nr:hypothetical protein AnigIFM50267_003120 [Aspergillus niger]